MFGALLGDFAKGPITDQWSEAIAAGIMLHRRVDRFTDAHPMWLRSRARFPPRLRRFAGITVDVVYDHFLARSWSHFHPQPLALFAQRAYAQVAEFEAQFPPRLTRVFPFMTSEDWLYGYRELDVVERALARMSTRSPRLAPLAETGDELRPIYTELAEDFHAFFPDLVGFVARYQAHGVGTCLALGSDRAKRS